MELKPQRLEMHRLSKRIQAVPQQAVLVGPPAEGRALGWLPERCTFRPSKGPDTAERGRSGTSACSFDPKEELSGLVTPTYHIASYAHT